MRTGCVSCHCVWNFFNLLKLSIALHDVELIEERPQMENVGKPRTTIQETNADWMCKLTLCLEFLYFIKILYSAP